MAPTGTTIAPGHLGYCASFKGAPPICFLCRQSGYIRKNCPRLEHVTCFNCKGKGHYARHCPEPKANERQQLDDYLESTQKVSEKVRDQQGRSTKRAKATKGNMETTHPPQQQGSPTLGMARQSLPIIWTHHWSCHHNNNVWNKEAAVAAFYRLV
jgi:hypothetical protein